MGTGVSAAACTTNLLVEDYSNYANHLNKLGEWTSGMFTFSLWLFVFMFDNNRNMSCRGFPFPTVDLGLMRYSQMMAP